MDVTPSNIIEEILDPLMFSDLASEYPSITMKRTAPNRVEVDFGLSGRVFVITVDEKPRA